MQVARTLLIVDDEEAILRSTKLLVELDDMTATTVHCAEDAFPAATARPPDVVLQDVRMPGLDLRAHLQQLRAHPATAGAAIVLFSASLDLPTLHEDPTLPHDAILEKPFSLPSLRSAIDAALEKRALRMAAAAR